MKILKACDPNMLWLLDGPMIGRCPKCGSIIEADPAVDNVKPGKVAMWPNKAHGWAACPECGDNMILTFDFARHRKELESA